MVYQRDKAEENLLRRPRFKRSLLAAYVVALSAAPAVVAQETSAEGELEEVIVTGMRSSLQSAQDIKRDAATVVESITAKDLGSFPDKSVAEALQRVAGVTVNRFAASSDTAHFSAEPSGVVVRGLNQVRTEFNGRDSFSANSSRGLSWGDISPELMSGVDTYKNQMAELIEGGIAGSVNMRTRVPFDQDGQMFAVTLSGNYGDLSEKLTPEASALYSNRWETSVGEFGFLANLAHSEVETRSQGNQLYRMNRFRGVYDVNGDETVDDNDLGYIPAVVNMRDNLYQRTRDGLSVALQYQNLDETLVVTTQFNRSEYENSWEEYIVGSVLADLSYGQSVFYEVPAGEAVPVPSPGTGDFTFDSDGQFKYGTAATSYGWWGGNDAESASYASNENGEPFFPVCFDWAGCSGDPHPSVRGIDLTTTSRSANNENMTQDIGVNVKWAISDTIRSSFDVQYIESTVTNYDIEVGFGSWATPTVDLTGDRPKLNLSPALNANMGDGGLSNASNYYNKYIMDHVEDSEGDQFAARMDFEFDINKGPIDSIKVGTRYANREQIIRWSDYNWEGVANTWTPNQAHYFNVTQTEPTPGGTNGVQPDFAGYPDDFYVTRKFSQDYHDLNVEEFIFPNMALLQDQARMSDELGATGLGLVNGVGWDPICSNSGTRAGEIPGTCTTPSELVDVREETTAAYIQLNFGGEELFGVPYSGNVGFRWIKTVNTSKGGVDFPLFSEDTLSCEPIVSDDPDAPPPPVPNTVGCYLSDEDIAFANGNSETSVTTKTHYHILPSLNVKFDFTDELVGRFALSKAMSRPDIGNMRNYTGLSATLPSETNANDPLWIKDGSGEITGAKVYYSAGAQNPYLAPVMATQADLALEYYFADVGSLTTTLFVKEFDDYIQYGVDNVEFMNNGETYTTEVRRPKNGEGAQIQGFEVAFQRFFDFLPAPFDGFGVQANYTYIDNQGITNTGVKNTEADGTTGTDQAPDAVSVNRLEGLSDHSYNLIGMYEKDDWAARLAYSWRSEYMVTAIDCCVAYPIWNEAYGQLDGSIKYDINDNFDVRFQVSNILNTETVLEQQVENYEDGGTRMPNAWFQNDRRFTLSVSYRY